MMRQRPTLQPSQEAPQRDMSDCPHDNCQDVHCSDRQPQTLRELLHGHDETGNRLVHVQHHVHDLEGGRTNNNNNNNNNTTGALTTTTTTTSGPTNQQQQLERQKIRELKQLQMEMMTLILVLVLMVFQHFYPNYFFQLLQSAFLGKVCDSDITHHNNGPPTIYYYFPPHASPLDTYPNETIVRDWLQGPLVNKDDQYDPSLDMYSYNIQYLLSTPHTASIRWAWNTTRALRWILHDTTRSVLWTMPHPLSVHNGSWDAVLQNMQQYMMEEDDTNSPQGNKDNNNGLSATATTSTTLLSLLQNMTRTDNQQYDYHHEYTREYSTNVIDETMLLLWHIHRLQRHCHDEMSLPGLYHGHVLRPQLQWQRKAMTSMFPRNDSQRQHVPTVFQYSDTPETIDPLVLLVPSHDKERNQTAFQESISIVQDIPKLFQQWLLQENLPDNDISNNVPVDSARSLLQQRRKVVEEKLYEHAIQHNWRLGEVHCSKNNHRSSRGIQEEEEEDEEGLLPSPPTGRTLVAEEPESTGEDKVCRYYI